jgi:hypothetical protein
VKEQGLHGLVEEDGQCACELDELMPCDEPKPTCRAVKLKSYSSDDDCGDEDCEWRGVGHWHEDTSQPKPHDPAT